MGAVFVGVRHHSPACARLVADVIDRLRPAHVLIEGPADFPVADLLLGHTPPVAIFSYVRGEHMSWTPFCDYSPEWVALTRGHAVGARVRFIDLPAWHPAFERTNRYADAERRYADAMDALCRAFAVDNVDTLWDHMVEAHPDDGLAERLETYFDLVRGEAEAGESDTEREAYMARWVRAAVRAGDGPVVVVTGGFHRPALVALCANDDGATGWPEVPAAPNGGSYLVPYSHKRLDAFTGYQSGMPSPGYYQRLWESGPREAAWGLMGDVATRLRQRKQVVSTADLIAARTMAAGLAALRGHAEPARADVLDGLVSALVSDGLDQPLPWSTRGTLAPGAHPVVVEMVAALTGDRVGALHPDTPAPPLLPEVTALLTEHGLDGTGEVELDLVADAARSRVLHRLRVLGVPGFERLAGPVGGGDPVAGERWSLAPSDLRLPALIEAAAHGATLADAATAVLAGRAADAGVGALADVLFDAVLCGFADVSDQVGVALAGALADARELAAVGKALATSVGLWRHDRLLGSAGSALAGAVVAAATPRALWLAEGVRGGPGPADLGRLAAIAAVRDALRYAPATAGTSVEVAVGVARRIAAGADVPPDLRGAATGLARALGADVDRSPPRAAGVVGDWLAGLFAVAREEVLADDALLAALDDVVVAMAEHDFLVALPALRQAFEFFPPSEREAIAAGLLRRRGTTGSARALVRLRADPLAVAEGQAVEAAVDRALAKAGLL
ncbi:DUF5682 family protein [Actinokineospora soli]|uniref:DUF5682 family protein n=1 Tax=Actinokineospora soli TaxID=1048753 RepID=A0ABW2TTG5_9PSEU